MLSHILGLDNASGAWYLWWSGFFGDLTIFAVPLILLRKHNCHQKWCLRLGRHPVAGTTFTVCKKHHPEDR